MNADRCNRRTFLCRSAAMVAGIPWALGPGRSAVLNAADVPAATKSPNRAGAQVAIARCRGYGPEVRAALARCFDLVGGIGSLVRSKTVTIKLNLTGTNFASFLGRPVGETYMTHPDTVQALVSLLLAAGARRVRLVESTQSRAALDGTLALADWDVNALRALGAVEFENTRNLGSGKRYAQLRVPAGGYMFSAFELNHAYDETDVMISIAKLKNHITAGVTLSLKNMFGLTPNSLYGDQAGTEDATAGRGPLHNPTGFERIRLPGLKAGIASKDPTYRVPRIIVDLCAARPVHLAVIDGITAMSGGEGPWCRHAAPLKATSPGVLIVGLNPVSADAVGTAVMGYADPRATRGTRPFHFCDNHLLLAEQAGLGTAELSQIDVRGLTLAEARHPYS